MLRIVSDSAAPNSVRFLDVETGAEIRGIMDAKILIDSKHINRAVLTIAVQSIDMQASEGYVAADGPGPEVSPTEDLVAAFPADAIGLRNLWGVLSQQLADIERSLAGMQANAGANAGACIGLTVDGGYDGVRTR